MPSATVSATLSVTLIGAGLIVLGLVIVAVTVSFWRGSAEDPEVLAPLEVMAGRRFARADDHSRTEMLAGVRPDEAGAGTRYMPTEALRGGEAVSGDDAVREGDDTETMTSVDPLLAGGERGRRVEDAE